LPNSLRGRCEDSDHTVRRKERGSEDRGEGRIVLWSRSRAVRKRNLIGREEKKGGKIPVIGGEGGQIERKSTRKRVPTTPHPKSKRGNRIPTEEVLSKDPAERQSTPQCRNGDRYECLMIPNKEEEREGKIKRLREKMREGWGYTISGAKEKEKRSDRKKKKLKNATVSVHSPNK